MKRTMFLVIFLVLLASLQYATDLSLGLFYGRRTMSDSDIKNTYGSGSVFFPFISLNIWKGIIIGGGYEAGYSREGKIGLYNESTSLKVTGVEFFIGYQLRMKIVSPYLRVGVGSFSYKQEIESPHVGEYKVDHKKLTFSLGGGLEFSPVEYLYLLAEIRYVPLKVKPYEYEVDLSGIRFLAGIGFRFKFK